MDSTTQQCWPQKCVVMHDCFSVVRLLHCWHGFDKSNLQATGEFDFWFFGWRWAILEAAVWTYLVFDIRTGRWQSVLGGVLAVRLRRVFLLRLCFTLWFVTATVIAVKKLLLVLCRHFLRWVSQICSVTILSDLMLVIYIFFFLWTQFCCCIMFCWRSCWP